MSRQLPNDVFPAIVACCLCDSAMYSGEKVEIVVAGGHQALAHEKCVDAALEEKDGDEEDEDEE